MTPTKMPDRPTSGGADSFLRFLETELIPNIENKYRVQPHRTIIGHSLSGLFVIYAFSSRPELFNAYLAASPHLLKKLNIKNIDFEFREIPTENHSSINIPVFHLGLKKVWKDLYIDQSASSVVSSGTAKKNFEIGVRLAEEGGNPELTQTIKETLQRIIQKLGDQK